MAPIDPAEPRRGNRLLVVEDDPDIMPLMVRALRRVDPLASLIWTLDSDAGLELIESGLCNAVVADYAIEGTSTGWVLWQLCRARSPSMPFGLMSALPLRAVETSGTPFLAKPFAIRDIAAFLQKILGESQAALASDETSLASSRTAPSAPH